MNTIYEIGTPVQSARKGTWSAVFNVYRDEPRYLISSIESAPVFANSHEALAGAERALTVLKYTDKFPNMCVEF